MESRPAAASFRVALVDGCEIYRLGVRALLAARRPEISVIDELERLDLARLSRARADALLVDLAVPDVDRTVFSGELSRRLPGSRVVVLSVQHSPLIVRRALEGGAAGYILKTQPGEQVLAALDAVASGETVVLPHLEEAAGKPGRKSRTPAGYAALSRREREVFERVVWGASNRRVADELDISIKTVETHRAHIYAKLGVHSTADLVRVAWFDGGFAGRIA
jgi:two-component system response regulator NreC